MGRHVVRAFLEAGCQVLVNDLNYKGVDDRAKRQEADIFSGDRDILSVCWFIWPGGTGLFTIPMPI